MQDYQVFKSRNGYSAIRSKHNRNDCKLMHNDFVMATGSHDFIARLFWQFCNQIT